MQKLNILVCAYWHIDFFDRLDVCVWTHCRLV